MAASGSHISLHTLLDCFPSHTVPNRAANTFKRHTAAQPWERALHLSLSSSPMLVCVGQVVLLVLCTAVFAIPNPAPSAPPSLTTRTSLQATAILASDAAPGSLRTPWTGRIPKSDHVVVQRATSSSSSTTASTTSWDDSLGQIVVTSTKMTTLPPAVCGFVPFSNQTSSMIGKGDSQH